MSGCFLSRTGYTIVPISPERYGAAGEWEKVIWSSMFWSARWIRQRLTRRFVSVVRVSG
ncbi:hypothetical protein GCM10011588_46250 [Nocardia jinanensis]|uniref:Uncharacterized protein n=1 Tax=Nocardia jinanensis TaxID=382504 RepID=A0A917RSN3_9NOCA|nr:hypothetical protein GCM10011588_46250 [Nocardia jinanensis]